ncbi:MAG: ISL3 family transposase, partial [Rhodanobacteraceae bacterium]
MTNTDTFQTLLRLAEPWFIAGIDIDPAGEAMHVRIDFRRDARLGCPECGALAEVYDRTEERVWRHLDLWQCKTWLHCRLPRVRCELHGVRQVGTPWAEPGSRLSSDFEARVIDTVLACQTVKAACTLLRLKWDQVNKVMARAVARGLVRREATAMPYLAVDEKAIAKRHRYATVLYDLTRGVVVEVANERRKASLAGLYAGLTGAQREAVQAVAMDMWEPFAQATAAGLPDGADKIVHDGFHVMQHANKAVNAMRVLEARALAKRGDDILKGSRQLWLFGHENVPEKRRADFAALIRADLETARAWAAKETLRRTWDKPTVAAARRHLRAWLRHVAKHLQGPMQRFALMVWEKLEPIIRYCEHPITTGKAEGINSKLMAIQRSARGFRSHASFRT